MAKTGATQFSTNGISQNHDSIDDCLYWEPIQTKLYPTLSSPRDRGYPNFYDPTSTRSRIDVSVNFFLHPDDFSLGNAMEDYGCFNPTQCRTSPSCRVDYP